MWLRRTAGLLCSSVVLFCIQGNIFVKTESSAQASCGSLNVADEVFCPLEAVLLGLPGWGRSLGLTNVSSAVLQELGGCTGKHKYTEGEQVMKSPWFLGQVLFFYASKSYSWKANRFSCLHSHFIFLPLCFVLSSCSMTAWLLQPLAACPAPAAGAKPSVSVLAKISRHLYGITNMGRWGSNLTRGIKEEK